MHWDGTSWTLMETPTLSAIRAIGGTASDDVFAAGDDGVLLHYDGTGWQSVRPLTTRDIAALFVTPRYVVTGARFSEIDTLLREQPWSCRAQESACGDGADDDCDGLVDLQDPDCAGAIMFQEIHADGTTDYVELINRTGRMQNLYDMHLAVGGTCGVQEHALGNDPVAAGQVLRVLDDGSIIRGGERFMWTDICDTASGSAWYAICAGPCDLKTCSNFFDYVEKGTAPANAPGCASFSPSPIDVSGATTTDSLQRSTYTGGGAAGVAADWAVGAMSRL
jgi:hypothetical protein